jgi:2-haloacid dehalogenase
MSTNRRHFIKTVGAAGVTAAAVRGASGRIAAAGSQSVAERAAGPGVRALAFDAYGTLFDVFSVTALCEELFPGQGAALAQLWRSKQLQYSLLRSLMGRYADFWTVTEDGLTYGARSLALDLTPARRTRLLDAYLRLTAFPDVTPGLEALRARGVRLAILSNGEPTMLEAAARSAGIHGLLDAIISADEVRVFKPDPRVYELGLRRLDTTTAEMGFVSSNSWDINGASAAGLTTFWIQRRAAEPPEELGFRASRVVGAITDL